MQTHYDILGVPFGADYETIKRAYRNALKKYHPDMHEGDPAAELLSKQIIDAHAVLKDPDLRAAYDETLLHGRRQRRRLLLITVLISAGLACGGSLAFLMPEIVKGPAVAAVDSLGLGWSGERGPPAKPERLAKADIPQARAVVSAQITDTNIQPAPASERIAKSETASTLAAATEPPAQIPTYSAAKKTERLASVETTSAIPEMAKRPAAPETPPAPTTTRELVTNAEITASMPEGVAKPTISPPPLPATEYVDKAGHIPNLAAAPRETIEAPTSVAALTPPVTASRPAGEGARSQLGERAANPAPIKAAFADIEESTDPRELWAVIQEQPWSYDAVVAERRLRELIDATDDVAILEELRAIIVGPIAERVLTRLEVLAALKDVTQAGLSENGAAAPPDQTASAPALTAKPDLRTTQEQGADSAANITPRDPEKHVRTGLAAMKAANHDGAIAAFDDAIRLDPANARYRLHRAAAWEAKGDLDQAIGDYDAAIGIDQNSIAAYHRRGLLWSHRGDTQRALIDFERAIRLSFSDATIYRDRGMVWYGLGRYNRAIADFSHAIELDPDLASAYVVRGKAFQKKGDLVTAAINFDKASRRDPSAAKAYRDLMKGELAKEVQLQKAPQPGR